MASVKNFQLVDPDEQNAVVLQVSSSVTLMLTKSDRIIFDSSDAWGKTSLLWIYNGLSALCKRLGLR
jgi:hypothetical protein